MYFNINANTDKADELEIYRAQNKWSVLVDIGLNCEYVISSVHKIDVSLSDFNSKTIVKKT